MSRRHLALRLFMYIVLPLIAAAGVWLWVEYEPLKARDPRGRRLAAAKAATPSAPALIPRVRLLPAATPTVALMDFAVDQPIHRWQSEAADLAAAVAEGLRDHPHVRWVERQQLSNARAEMQLAPLSSLDAAQAMRLGQWLKSDLMITGHFITTGEPRLLRLEVVELSRADRLATADIPLASAAPTDSLLKNMDVGDLVTQCTQQAGKLLEEAKRRLAQTARRPVVAPLFVRALGSTGRLAFMEASILERLHGAAETAGLRSLRFSHGAEGTDETELAILGLSDGNHDAWKGLADFYLWGSIEELESDQEQLAFDQLPIRLTVWLWDCGRDPVEFTETATVAEAEAMQQRLVQRVVTAASASPTPTVSPASRDQLVKQLRTRVSEAQQRRGQLTAADRSPENNRVARAIHRYQTRVLETAIFLSPRDFDLRNMLVQHRWRGWFAPRRPLDRLNESRRLVELFGFDHAGGDDLLSFHLDGLNGAAKAFTWPAPDMGFPGDLPESELRRLVLEFLGEVQGFEADYRAALAQVEARAPAAFRVFDWRGDQVLTLIQNVLALPAEPRAITAAVDAWWPYARAHYAAEAANSFDPQNILGEPMPHREQWEDRLLGVYEAAGQADRIPQMLWLKQEERSSAGAVGSVPWARRQTASLLERYSEWYEAGKRGVLPQSMTATSGAAGIALDAPRPEAASSNRLREADTARRNMVRAAIAGRAGPGATIAPRA